MCPFELGKCRLEFPKLALAAKSWESARRAPDVLARCYHVSSKVSCYSNRNHEEHFQISAITLRHNYFLSIDFNPVKRELHLIFRIKQIQLLTKCAIPYVVNKNKLRVEFLWKCLEVIFSNKRNQTFLKQSFQNTSLF